MNKDSENKGKAFHPDLNGRDSKELSSQYSSQSTVLSFQRTRLSADRTLMSVMRTSLSLIGFGFTIFQFFHHLQEYSSKFSKVPAVKTFSVSMVILGLLILLLGIVYHVNFMLQVRKEREAFIQEGLLEPADKYPVSMSLIVAVLLFLLGILAIIVMGMQIEV